MGAGKKSKITFLLLTLIVLMAVALFAYQNNSEVDIMLFVKHVKSKLGLLIVITFLLGLLSAWATLIPLGWKREADLLKYKKRTRRLERDLQDEILKNKQLTQKPDVDRILEREGEQQA